MVADIRPAVADDAEGIGRMHVQSHRETYAEVLSPEFLAAMSVVERIDRWRGLLDGGVSEHWVAVDDGDVVGFVTSGPSRDEPPVRQLELHSLYLLASHHRSGLGSRMLDLAIGRRPASLWVVAGNDRALAFYRRHGFELDGETVIYRGWGDSTGLRMVR